MWFISQGVAQPQNRTVNKMTIVKKYPCISCALRPLIVFGRWFGFSPIHSKCATRTEPCIFKPSLFWIGESILVTVIILVSIILILIEPNKSNLSLDKGDDDSQVIAKVITTIECINHITSIVLLVLNMSQCKVRTKALNSMTSFIHNTGSAENRGISIADQKSLYITGIKQIISLLVLVVAQNIVIFVCLSRNWDRIESVSFVIWKGVLASVSNAVFLVNGFEFSVITKLLKIMILIVHKQLKGIMQKTGARAMGDVEIKRLADNQIKYIVPYKKSKLIRYYSETKLCDRIGDIRRLYGTVVKSLHQYNYTVNPQLALVTILVMISVVLTCYLLYQYMVTESEEIMYLLISGRLFLNMMTVFYMIYLSEQLYKMVRQTKCTRFLFCCTYLHFVAEGFHVSLCG